MIHIPLTSFLLNRHTHQAQTPALGVRSARKQRRTVARLKAVITRQFLHLCALLALTGTLGVGSTIATAADSEQEKRAPNFTLPANNAQNMRLSEHVGDIVMLTFWASWCDHCLTQLKDLNTIAKEGKIKIWSIVLDDDPTKALRKISKLDLQFPVLFDSNQRVAKQYAIEDLPSVVLINRDGLIRYHNNGYKFGQFETYLKQIDTLIKEYRVDPL